MVKGIKREIWEKIPKEVKKDKILLALEHFKKPVDCGVIARTLRWLHSSSRVLELLKELEDEGKVKEASLEIKEDSSATRKLVRGLADSIPHFRIVEGIEVKK